MGYEGGLKGEDYFRRRMTKLGLDHEFIDEWYDFRVCKDKVEVKSCRLTVKDNANKLRIGRFDFTSEENREKRMGTIGWITFHFKITREELLFEEN